MIAVSEGEAQDIAASLRAGLVPAVPDGWSAVVCQPGENPLAGLARALLPEFEGDRAVFFLSHFFSPKKRSTKNADDNIPLVI